MGKPCQRFLSSSGGNSHHCVPKKLANAAPQLRTFTPDAIVYKTKTKVWGRLVDKFLHNRIKGFFGKTLQ